MAVRESQRVPRRDPVSTPSGPRLDPVSTPSRPRLDPVWTAGDAHRFWNAGTDDLRCTGYIEPADNVEYFLGAIFESAKQSGKERPDPFDAAYLLTRYKREFALLDIPAAVQRLVFPVQVALGRLFGRYAKYANAPEPVRR